MTPTEFRTRTSCAHQTKLTSPIRTALHHLHLSNPSLSLPLLHRSDSGGLLSESRPNSSHLPLKRALQSNNPRSHFTPRAHFLHSHTITIRSRKRRELPTQKKDSHPRFSSFGILTKKNKMPYLPTSQAFLEQSAQLLQAYPDTVRSITLVYLGISTSVTRRFLLW